MNKDTSSQLNGHQNDDKSVVTLTSVRSQADHPAKVCQRIWSAYSKYIRQQCKRNKVVDSVYFGIYAKKETDSNDLDEGV